MPGCNGRPSKALTDTTELTDTVYFVHPTALSTFGSASRDTAEAEATNCLQPF